MCSPSVVEVMANSLVSDKFNCEKKFALDGIEILKSDTKCFEILDGYRDEPTKRRTKDVLEMVVPSLVGVSSRGRIAPHPSQAAGERCVYHNLGMYTT